MTTHVRYAGCTTIALTIWTTAFAQDAAFVTQHERLVDGYASGTYVAAVVEAATLDAAEAAKRARALLDTHADRYERSLVSIAGQKRVSYEGGVQGYLRVVRAVAALHLEVAIALPPGRMTASSTHLEIADAARRTLDATRAPSWTRDVSVDGATLDALRRFRRDWWLVAVTHFQRAGRFSEGLRLVASAAEEFPDDPQFHVIAGSMFEALASPISTIDYTRHLIGLPLDHDDATKAALLQAARAFERALTLRPQDAEARVRLARVQVQRGEFAAADRLLEADAPPGRLAYLRAMARGHAAEARGQYDRASEHYRAATGLATQWQSGCVALAHALAKQGRNDEARSALRECLSTTPAPDDPWRAYAMGMPWLVEPTVRQMRALVSGRTGALQ